MSTMRRISSRLGFGALGLVMATAGRATPDFRIQLDTVTSGYDGRTCWAQARAGAIPRAGQPPIVVITMNKLIITGSDVYLPIHDMRTDDLGKTWSPPREHAMTLGRRQEASGLEVGISDFWPKYHAKSGRLLGMGQTFRYRGERRPEAGSGREVVYSAYDPDTRAWDAWAVLDLSGTGMAVHAGAGCAQRLDLPNGELLLPIYFTPQGGNFSHVRVLRCSYDGKLLRRLAHGNALTLETKRGFAEPSLAHFRGKYYLTIRHDDAAHVTTSDDGLQFAPPQLWRWDDGELLGSYNTQTHWVTHDDGLFLVYTRRGANNDHVFRHRAPLFIAEVDPATLSVRRATERILIPERGARYGNFGVCDVNANETWVVETEWMQKPGRDFVIPVDNPWGAAARVYASRILWAKPNTGWGR
jgi:hypothetical protein